MFGLTSPSAFLFAHPRLRSTLHLELMFLKCLHGARRVRCMRCAPASRAPVSCGSPLPGAGGEVQCPADLRCLVFVGCGCRDRVPPTAWPKPQHCGLRVLEAEARGPVPAPAGGSWHALASRSQAATSPLPCPYVAGLWGEGAHTLVSLLVRAQVPSRGPYPCGLV